LRLKEPSTQLRCREQDLAVIQSVIKSAKQAYAEQLNVDVPEVFVDDKHFLPGPPESSNHGSSWYFCSLRVMKFLIDDSSD
jgi:V-type H+-transporting ATPase subunit E